MASHFALECTCGQVLSQCRCGGAKQVFISSLPCEHGEDTYKGAHRLTPPEPALPDTSQMSDLEKRGYYSNGSYARDVATYRNKLAKRA